MAPILSLLTGVGRRGQVGEMVARRLGERGDTLLVVDRSADLVESRADELRVAGFSASGYACDLSDAAMVDEMMARVRREHGAIDNAVLMAGGFSLTGPVAESDPAELEKQITINLRTAFFAARGVIPLMRARGGSIVFFASEAILPGSRVAGVSAYAIAKQGVATLMRAISQEERASGIRANALAPAAIRTLANTNDMGDDKKYVEREDVADVVAFLCSDAGASVTGQTVHLAAKERGAVPSPG